MTEGLKVEVGWHQGLALTPFLISMLIDRLADEVRQESPFADDTVICSERRELLEANLERLEI